MSRKPSSPQNIFRLTTTGSIELDGAESVVKISTGFTINPECPPSLVDHVMAGIGKFVAETQGEESAERIAAEIREIVRRRQRQADNVARQLLGEGETEP